MKIVSLILVIICFVINAIGYSSAETAREREGWSMACLWNAGFVIISLINVFGG